MSILSKARDVSGLFVVGGIAALYMSTLDPVLVLINTFGRALKLGWRLVALLLASRVFFFIAGKLFNHAVSIMLTGGPVAAIKRFPSSAARTVCRGLSSAAGRVGLYGLASRFDGFASRWAGPKMDNGFAAAFAGGGGGSSPFGGDSTNLADLFGGGGGGGPSAADISQLTDLFGGAMGGAAGTAGGASGGDLSDIFGGGASPFAAGADPIDVASAPVQPPRPLGASTPGVTINVRKPKGKAGGDGSASPKE
jgi:hypothetical protein